MIFPVVCRNLGKLFFRIFIALIRRQEIPLERFHTVLGNTFAIIVTVSEVVLRPDKSLIRRFEVPFDRFRIVLNDSIAVETAVSEIALRIKMPLIRRSAIP